MKINLLQGDITQQHVDAVVNAANTSLLGGAGVDGAIHRGAGPELLAECRKIGGCPTGEARMTDAYRLPARHIIHTVGPIWRGGNSGEVDLLSGCYRSCYNLARSHGLVSIVFPAISTGAYRFPHREATEIARRETEKMMTDPGSLDEVRFACFTKEMFDVYGEVFEGLAG